MNVSKYNLFLFSNYTFDMIKIICFYDIVCIRTFCIVDYKKYHFGIIIT